MEGDFYIGERLVQPRINSIRQGEDALHLEPKVMQVLLVLASKPGEVFTREEIRQVVWRDVFVGDDVLMRAVSEIRRLFEDKPQTPHTIQTVPKVGYRLIAPVRKVMGSSVATAEIISPEPHTLSSESVPESTVLAPVIPLPLTPVPLITRPTAPSRSIVWKAAITIVAILLSVAAFALTRSHRTVASAASFVSHPLTTYSGSQLEPALSPNGETVAFIWKRDAQEGHRLYVKAVKSGTPARLTNGDADELSPAWSPDGSTLAFIRRSSHGSSVQVMPVIGGSERQVYEFPVDAIDEYGGLTWSTDGARLIFPSKQTAAGPSRLVEFSLGTHTSRFLTDPPSGWNGDSMPAVSPDGKLLAFARGSEQSTRDIYVMDLPDGTPRQLTSDAHMVLGLVWTSDSSKILFSSNRGGTPALWRISLFGGTPERDYAGSDGAYWPSVSRRGDLLAYSRGSASWSIASVALNSASGSSPETEVLTSSEQDSSPAFSPSADELAFQSWRSGSQEIWASAVDGSDPTQLTGKGASAGSPSWSRDGKLIAFDARPEGFAHIYITDREGTSPLALTTGKYNDIVPGWSADDRTIYFGSNRSGSWQIWSIPADGSRAPQQVTSNGGMVAKASADGKWIYFTNATSPGIWRKPLNGGAEERIFDNLPPEYSNYWTLSGNEIYTLSVVDGHRALVQVDPATRHAKQVHTLLHDPALFSGLTVSPDSKHMMFSEMLEAKSNLTLVEHFQ